MKIIAFKEDIIYLNDEEMEELNKLLEKCAKLVNNPELVTSPKIVNQAIVKLSAWNVFIGVLAGRAESDYRTQFSERYKHYKTSGGKKTVDDCKNFAEVDIKDVRRAREVLNNLRDDIKELHQTLRAIIKNKDVV